VHILTCFISRTNNHRWARFSTPNPRCNSVSYCLRFLLLPSSFPTLLVVLLDVDEQYIGFSPVHNKGISFPKRIAVRGMPNQHPHGQSRVSSATVKSTTSIPTEPLAKVPRPTSDYENRQKSQCTRSRSNVPALLRLPAELRNKIY